MQRFTFSSGSLPGRIGRGVRVAVVDSGIHAAHPHVQGISGGLAFHDHGGVTCDVVDRLGHGTAVAAAIREKAPGVDLIAVKVFDRSLAATAQMLANAIRWASQHVTLINLSLGTTNPQHEAALEAAVREALARGTLIVAAAPHDDCRWLPGAIPGVIAVEPDWDIDRNTCEVLPFGGDGVRLRASPYPRPIPGVPPERNLKGVSFAVANATGLLALVLEDHPVSSLDELAASLAAAGQTPENSSRNSSQLPASSGL